MRLNEEKAKEILDFLAKKAGYERVEIFLYSESQYWLEFCGKRNGCLVLAYDNILDCYKNLYFRENSYVACLKRMLELSNKNFSIVTDDLYYKYKETCVVKPYTTLEELLIRHDLEENY